MSNFLYFIEEIEINDESLTTDDLIVAYNGDVIVGSRYWYGEVTDVPAMGLTSGDDKTAGYCEVGNPITFKVFDNSEGELIEMALDAGKNIWSNNGMTVVTMSDKVLPTEVSLSKAYPNPFNPTTTIELNLSEASYASVKVFNLRGEIVGVLMDGMVDASTYTMTWDASNLSSGVYMIRAEANGQIATQKVMLVK